MKAVAQKCAAAFLCFNYVGAEKNLVAEYKYDAWGNHRVYTSGGIDITENLSYNNSIAKLNPFRYRGYYYDTETGLYYLNSRYYDPSIGRFINADDISYIQPTDINGLNLFAYCGNNPVMYVDPYGHEWWHWLIGGLIVIGLATLTCFSAGSFLGGMFAIGLAANGVVSSALATSILAYATVGAASVYVASAIVAGLGSLELWITGGSFQDGLNVFAAYGENAMWSTAFGGMIGAFGGYLSYKQQAITHSWTTERKRYWINQSNNPKSQWYGNSRAAKGYAPIVDGYPVQLHHTMGRGGANFYYYVEMTRSQHIQYHQIYGYKNFSSYTANINFWSLLF